MSPNILSEISYLSHSFLTGILITMIYDVLRILRRVVSHKGWAVSLEDFVYWLCCSVLAFGMLYQENNGILRWFAVAGAAAGMLLYKKTLGNFFVKYFSIFINKLLHLVGKILFLTLRPPALVVKKIFRQVRKAGKWLKMRIRGIKKRLTQGRKALKMVVCKR